MIFFSRHVLKFLLQKDIYPNGFFIVLVVNADDSECSGKEYTIPKRQKHVTVTIQNSVTKHDYIIASVTSLSIILGFCIIYITGAITCKVRHSRILREQSIQDELDRTQQSIASPEEGQSSGFREVVFITFSSKRSIKLRWNAVLKFYIVKSFISKFT